MHSSRMQQNRERNRTAALRFLGKGLSTSQCRPPSEQRWQLLCNSVSRRQCVNQKDASDDQNLIRLWRCSNPDQQWELCQNLGCIWVASRVSTDCSNRDMFAWLRDESCLQVDWSALSQVPQRDATVVLRCIHSGQRGLTGC